MHVYYHPCNRHQAVFNRTEAITKLLIRSLRVSLETTEIPIQCKAIDL